MSKNKLIKCNNCGDHRHGCMGSGKSNGDGYDHCIDYDKEVKEHNLSNVLEISKYLKEKHNINVTRIHVREWIEKFGFPAAFLTNKTFTTEERIDLWIQSVKDGGMQDLFTDNYTIVNRSRVKKRDRNLTDKRKAKIREKMFKIKRWMDKKNEEKAIKQIEYMVEKGLSVNDAIKVSRALFMAVKKDLKIW
ncbi:MAG: hypothetical protein GQ540_03750 [Lutibacter sp.]|uniref:hypothetical protein n=1 Tax=Lutibacter sp. TaxID=1925666 RepID=UPI001A0829A8|nr:hypothetical protein [Lutibacter sp.]NOR27627.1 hypothetical protein [Lutibacter sp.]